MCGFGAGLAWGAVIIRWTAVDQRLSQDLKETIEKSRPEKCR